MFELPVYVRDQLEGYRAAVYSFLNKELSDERFKGIRVPWGIYSERRSDTYMMRIRLPGGECSPAQLQAIGDAANQFADGRLHLTTRQDIQIHHVSIAETVNIIEYLHNYELSPYGGGGNTVRNIMGCPYAGICGCAAFDTRPYVDALSEYLLADEQSVRLPRKFKVAVSSCGNDCSGCLVNDVGLLALHQGGKRGFAVYAGGGMGAQSRVGQKLEDFLEEGQVGSSVMAIRNVFFKNGDRKYRRRKRMRFMC